MSDLDSLHSQERSAKSKIHDYEEDQRRIRNKISRLKTAKKQISDHKDTVLSQQYNGSTLVPDYGFYGSNFNMHLREVQENYNQRYSAFYNQTDQVEETINWKITELENESRDIDGWIGDTLNWLNDILTRIQNFFN